MAKSAKKRVGRPPGRKAPHRPVLSTSARVSEDFYTEVVQAAQKSGRTISEELIARVRQSFEWERQFGDIRKLGDDARRAIAGDLRQAMIKEGYTPIHGSAGTQWAEPGSAVSEAVKGLLAEAKDGQS
jgi:hypothetical protein